MGHLPEDEAAVFVSTVAGKSEPDDRTERMREIRVRED
jgi:hypothetical protein